MKKRISPILAAFLATGLVWLGLFAVGVNAIRNPNGKPLSNSPVSKAADLIPVSSVNTIDPATLNSLQSQISQYQARIQEYQARETQYKSQLTAAQQEIQQAASQIQQYQAIIMDLQSNNQALANRLMSSSQGIPGQRWSEGSEGSDDSY